LINIHLLGILIKETKNIKKYFWVKKGKFKKEKF